jgi:hypothetical protein
MKVAHTFDWQMLWRAFFVIMRKGNLIQKTCFNYFLVEGVVERIAR